MGGKFYEEYRKSDNLQEIEDFVKYLSENSVVFFGWQRRADGRRVLYRFKMGEINPREPEVKLTCVDEEINKLELNPEQKLYTYTDSQRYVAELDIVYQGEKHLFVLPPDLMFIKDQRKVPRITLNSESCFVKFTKDKKEFDLPIADISETGMAFYVNKKIAKFFNYPKHEPMILKIPVFKLTDMLFVIVKVCKSYVQ